MTRTATPERWHPGQQLLHWGMAVLVLAQVILGLWLAATPHSSALREPLFHYHASLGVTLLLLVSLRLLWRLSHPGPELPASLPASHKTIARLTHLGLYGLLFALPVLGILMNSVYGEGTPFWGLFKVPPVVAENRALGPTLLGVHVALGLGIVLLIAAHAAAALRHEFLLRDNVLRRITPLPLRPDRE